MSLGIIIHVSVGSEKRTEFFNEETVRIGTADFCELQIHTKKLEADRVWLVFEKSKDFYQLIDFAEDLGLKINGEKPRRFVEVKNGDTVTLDLLNISFSFFSLQSQSSLITTNHETHVAPFIEDAALESSATEKRDDAKAFLREFSRELLREIGWKTKLIVLVLIVGIFSGAFYLFYGFYREMQKSRELAERQSQVITNLEGQIVKTKDQMSELDKSNRKVFEIMSLAPNLRVEYGNGVCLIVGVYDLVDKNSGKPLRYPDPNSYQPGPNDYQPDPYEPMQSEEGMYEMPPQTGLTTEGNGAAVEYDFLGTGFHVGGGYILTNRHVLQPWTEDDGVKQLMRSSNGRARIKRLVVYFPTSPNPIQLSVKRLSYTQDLGVATVPISLLPKDTPTIPLETNANEPAVGKTVVSMGYPNGPDRLLAMADDREAKTIAEKYGSSRQALITYLAQTGKITPLTTQGTITDLDPRRVVHDAATAEGGSGAPLFGQTGKVIGVNFGVFTESNAANMAVPIVYGINLLRQAGWQMPEPKSPANNLSANAGSQAKDQKVPNKQ
ncbi:MAG: trypsin-like peptidase domain-containing protein [Pyrinomonadaceae bacterium]